MHFRSLIKKMKNKKKIIKRVSTPEDFLFGFLVVFAISFAVMCLASVKNIPVTMQVGAKDENEIKFGKDLRKMVDGYPMEKMTQFIAKKDRKVAAYLMAIAKKESNWGKHSPRKYGKECYNYWGFRGKQGRTRSGYSCFDSPKQAVQVVGRRIGELVAAKVDTPQEMVLWKCGSVCAGREARGAKKWISDVDYYYRKVYN